MTEQKILVTGGTGKTGRRVVKQLQERHIPVRIGSRRGQPAFDWEAEETWKPALEGIHAVYIAYQPDLAIPGAVKVIQKFVDTAVGMGVQRLVLLSGRGEEEAQACERIVAQSGIQWTVIRASFFAQNFSEGFILEAIQQGQVVLPVVSVPEPFIDIDDIADIATVALTEDGHHGEIYEVTGSRLLTFEEAIAEIAETSGRHIDFIPVPIDAYVEGAKAAGLSEDYLWLLNYLFTTLFDGRNAIVSDGVQRALGREPRAFSDYVQQTAKTGIWAGQESITLQK